ncbi:MAG: YhhN-like protein [Candidatus Hydrogenedentes bacterium ADurb.Bin179]|nr:MAG: YhhN-like protein [Candidatus Hydrogenedentes bacterium ADurb.Bin179]
MPLYLTLCYLILALIGTASSCISIEVGIGIIKALPTLFLTACAWAYTRPRFGPWVIIGVVTGALGDFSLASAERSWFMAGVITFLIGHIAYSVAFAKELKSTRMRISFILATLLLMNVLVVLVFLRMIFVGEQALIVPVIIYVAVMSVMMTITMLHRSPTRFITAGGLVFVLSDAHIALNHMLLPTPRLNIALSGYATYYLAQYLLVAGAVYESRLWQRGSST